MKRSRPAIKAMAISLKPLKTGVYMFFLFAASLMLIVMERNQSTWLESARSSIVTAAAPVIETLARPADALKGVTDWVKETMALREENQRLRIERDRLLHWQYAATGLSTENKQLRHLLNAVPPKRSAFISARIAVNAVTPYSRAVIVDAGSTHGVVNNSAVINESGMAGRLVDVSQQTSRMMLLTDINSRIPVIGEQSRERAIAGGNGADEISLLYLPETTKITLGETVVTAGDGKVLPSGIPVGTVVQSPSGGMMVMPYVDWRRLEFVSIVDAGK